MSRASASRWPRLEARVLAVIFAGGVAGGLARYGVTQTWPGPRYGFPWAVFAINTAGAFALALLIVVLADVRPRGRLLRPLLGTGLLGAFTTFSSVVVAVDRLAAHGHLGTALAYLAASAATAPIAGWCGIVLGRAAAARRRRLDVDVVQ